jgi:flagellar hook-basal body complex protein FliE
MDKVLLKESIKQVEESVKVSKDNLRKAQQHIDEGEVILKALKAELKLFG